MRTRLRATVAALVAGVALLAPASAAASVRLVGLTSPVSPGRDATLVVRVSPATVVCSITVSYESGLSTARGLAPKRPTAAGRVGWTWRIGTRTTPGRWPIVVSCGRAGSLRASIRVSRGASASEASTTAIEVGRTVLLGSRTRTRDCRLGARPDRRCSPGAYDSRLTVKVICGASFRTSAIRHVSQATKSAVEREYGLTPRRYGSALEIDHVVPLELGGSNAIANLFPERAGARSGYQVKDRLENELHDLVCARRMALRAARVEIAADWRALDRKVHAIESAS